MGSSLFALFDDFVRRAPDWAFWLCALCLGMAAVACCYFGVSALYRSRLIADTPTSKVRSAAQGYVELEGVARMMPGEPIYAPLSGKPCVWYSYSVEQKGRGLSGRSEGWGTLESGVSEAIFHLADGTGVCIVDPDGAKVTPSIRLSWCGDSPRPLYTPNTTGFWSRLFSFGAYRYTESRLHDHDRLYAIGQFRGLGDAGAVSVSEATRDLLSAWKRDRTGLLQRFDANGDGKIDMEEWENARRAAEREVVATWRKRRQETEINLLNKPPDGRPYILSSMTQDKLITSYRKKTILGILGFLALGMILSWIMHRRFG